VSQLMFAVEKGLLSMLWGWNYLTSIYSNRKYRRECIGFHRRHKNRLWSILRCFETPNAFETGLVRVH